MSFLCVWLFSINVHCLLAFNCLVANTLTINICTLMFLKVSEDAAATFMRMRRLMWPSYIAAVCCFVQAHSVCIVGRSPGPVTWSCNLYVFFLFFSLFASLLVGLPFVILNVQQKPFLRGFFCNDDTIKYPFKEETISYQLLGGVMIPVTILAVSASVFC